MAEEELATDMIYNFVLPEVKKRDMRRTRDRQQSYMRHAHEAIYKTMLDLPSIESSRMTDRETCVKCEDVQRTICVDDMVRIDSLLI